MVLSASIHQGYGYAIKQALFIFIGLFAGFLVLKNPISLFKKYSNSLTAVMMPEGHDADALRKVILDNYNMSLGMGLNKVKGKVFRIGHLGDFNDLMLSGTLAGVEMGLAKAGVPFKKGGILAALDYLSK